MRRRPRPASAPRPAPPGRLGAAALLAALALGLPSALAGASQAPGVSEAEIVLGGTVPLSGPESAYSAVAQGAEAYFRYVNDQGGVYGRRIRYVYLDDGYDPAQTVQQTRRLVEDEGVLAVFNSVGTEHALAVRPYLNELGVPHLFLGSGARALVRDAGRYPWTVGYLPSFVSEGRVYGRYLASARPGARVAVLYEDSDFGRDLAAGLAAGLRGRARVVARASYAVTDADVSSPIAALRSSRADTLALFALPKQTIQAFIAADKLGWRPQVVVASVSIDPFVMTVARLNTHGRTTEGAVSSAFLKDASNLSRWGKDAGVRLYYRIMRRYNPQGDVRAVAHLYGMAVAHTMVAALRGAGRNPSRASLLRSALSLRSADNPFLLPGIVVETGPGDRRPIEQVQLFRYARGVWTPLGPLVAAR